MSSAEDPGRRKVTANAGYIETVGRGGHAAARVVLPERSDGCGLHGTHVVGERSKHRFGSIEMFVNDADNRRTHDDACDTRGHRTGDVRRFGNAKAQKQRCRVIFFQHTNDLFNGGARSMVGACDPDALEKIRVAVACLSGFL